MRVCFSILFSAFCLIFPVDSALKYVQVLFRHGDRTPTHVYPRDPNQIWNEGWEQLTNIGRRDGYELGQFLKRRYVDSGFLSPNYTVGDVLVTSSSKDRCIMTAECMLAGLYPPSGDQVWEPSINWQPIPVHAIPKEHDFMLHMSCPTYDALKEEMMKSDFIKSITTLHQDLIDLVGIHSGYEPTFESLIKMIDPIYVENAHNRTFPDWLRDKDTFKRFLYLKDMKAQLKFHTKEMAKIKGGPILKRMLKNMDDMQRFYNVTQKIDFYAAHDTTINGMLSLLGVFNGIHMMYAAALIVELHQSTSNTWSVEVYYRNDTHRDLVQLTIPGCIASCPLSQLQELTKDVIPDDPVTLCLGSRTSESCTSGSCTLSISTFSTYLVIMTALTVFTLR